MVVLIWLGTGFFIVQEGQQAVITQFGKFRSTASAGFKVVELQVGNSVSESVSQ